MNSLHLNLLTYIAYCVENRIFSYEKCQRDLASAGYCYDITTLRKEFSYAKNAGLIEFKTYYRKPYPVLTQKGRLEIKTRLPFRKFDWDGSWKMVIFDIPKAKRNARLLLYKELINLGFGKLSRGVFISPRPVFSLVMRMAKKLKIENNIICIKVTDIDTEKISQAWDLDKVDVDYAAFIKKAKKISISRPAFWPLHAKALEQEFARLYAQDPHLPENILPKSWHGREAYSIFKATSNSY